MATKTKKVKVTDAYFELVKAFPLVRLLDDAHLVEAISVLDALLPAGSRLGWRSLLEVLTGLVEDYEDEHILIADAPANEVLRELMRQHGLTRSALPRPWASPNPPSRGPRGERKLTISHAGKLAKHFRLKPETFIDT